MERHQIIQFAIACAFVFVCCWGLLLLLEFYTVSSNEAAYHFGANEYQWPFSAIYSSAVHYKSYLLCSIGYLFATAIAGYLRKKTVFAGLIGAYLLFLLLASSPE